MIGWLLLAGLVGGGLLQMLGEAIVPPKHRFGYAVTVSTLSGCCLIAAGVLLYQEPPWTPPENAGDYNTHGGRGGLIGSLIILAINVGPQKTGLAIMALGLFFLWPLIRDRIQQAQRPRGNA